MNTPFLIAGTGAMACLFAARLAAAGVPVTMFGNWPEGLEALARHGVRLVEADGREQAYPVSVNRRPEACTQAGYAVVLVKSWQTERTARQLAGCITSNGLALTLQNGLGNQETLAQALGEERVTLGVTTAGATLLGLGRVRAGGGDKISINGHPRLLPLETALSQAGFQVEHVSEPKGLLWSKLVISTAINPLTAVLGVRNGELLERSPARELMAALANETTAVATAQGIQLPYSDPVAAAERVARQTSANYSSMLQDVQRGAPTEIDAICGAVVRAGEKTGVPTPANRVVWQIIQAMENCKGK